MSNPALMMAISGSLHYTPAAASGFTDDFSNPTTSAANWAMSLRGTAGGAYAFNTGSAVLTPKASAINSVAMRHTGTFKSVAATISQASNPGDAQYLTLSLGTGAITGEGGTNWWFTLPKIGYGLGLNSSNVVNLYKCNGSTATIIASGSDATPIASRFTSRVYELILSPTGVVVKINGTTVITSADTAYVAGGDILVAQGEYTSGNGGIATLTKVVGA
jgi:hypothetical protein